MKPLVSVIVPVHNAEKTIEKCVESLALGRMRDLEIILVDDCSVDGSWELCRELALRFSQVKCIRNEENRGVSYSRNRGLDQASGEFICFVDSDDWVSEHYSEELLGAAKANPDALVICGLHFLNRVEDYRRIYLWSPEGERFLAAKKDFFALHEKFLLPQVWNKIFRWDVIEDHHLRFDENQSMGEDFQFVLDYLRAAKTEHCVVMNRPLYYYTRNSSATLMSGFGHEQREAEFTRYAMLRELTGAEEAYEAAIERMKGNFVYHCVRNSKEPKPRQLELIEEITGDGRAQEHYRNLQTVRCKEAVVLALRGIRQRLALTWGDFWREKNRRTIERTRAELGDRKEPVTIFSQNCIGGMFYKDMGLPFASPTVGLFLRGGDFVRFALEPKEYLSRELRMRWGEEYPVGMLGDLQIHFMHYDTCREAKEAWERRCGRINWDRIVVLCTDRDGFTTEDFETWKKVSCPKVLFTANQAYRNHPDSLYFVEYRRQACAGELIPRRKFYRHGTLVRRIANIQE